jgi:hypothetical protein
LRVNLWQVEVYDLSRGGVGLLINRRFEKGTLLALEFRRPQGVILSRMTARRKYYLGPR